MTDGVSDAVAEWPAADESVVVREEVTLLTREMLLTASADMAVVRIFGSDKSGNAVRLGVSPERALRIGAAFIRAGLRVNPALRAQVVDETIDNAIAAPPTTTDRGQA
jgi:hypothetical protein